jgi:serine/threonine protein kinase
MLAIKQLKSDSKQEFQQEEDALYRIQRLNHNHLIKVIASFKKGQDYFFLFPWADGGDLQHMWKDPVRNTEHRKPEMIQWVLEQMKGIASGVKELHHPSDSPTSGENGRHGDLRPDNILLFIEDSKNHPRGTLRITDAGLSRFHEKITSKRTAGTNTQGGSIEYAPPESRKEGKDVKRSRKYDMWSLGCIFLEITIWVLGGIAEVKGFRDARKTERSENYQYYQIIKNKSGETYKIHPEVENRILWIRSDLRCLGNTWFQDFLVIIENHLFKTDEKARINAIDLDDRLDNILEKAKGKPSYLCGSDTNLGFAPRPFAKGTCKLFSNWSKKN